jgi:hypothetical protein
VVGDESNPFTNNFTRRFLEEYFDARTYLRRRCLRERNQSYQS